MIFTAAHAGAGSNGLLSHTYAFDDFTVNGHRLNEVGINALVASEYGVAVSMVTGDQVVIAQAKEILGPGIVGVVVKQAFGRTAAMTLSPARVRKMLTDSAAVAVRRALRGEFKPYHLDKPYQVVFTLRKSYPDSIAAGVDSLHWPGLEKTGPRAYRYTIGDARQIGYLLDAIEGVVLKP
jgi:D-amino peptidase